MQELYSQLLEIQKKMNELCKTTKCDECPFNKTIFEFESNYDYTYYDICEAINRIR